MDQTPESSDYFQDFLIIERAARQHRSNEVARLVQSAGRSLKRLIARGDTAAANRGGEAVRAA